jgi:protein-disulfide isomerase
MRRLRSIVPVAATLLAACASRESSAHSASSESAERRPSAPAVATAAKPASTDTAGDAMRQRADRARILGDPAAQVWMVEVSDFQCPFCARFHRETFSELRSAYITPGKVKLAYVNFPLEMHQHAWPAAEAAMCAGALGKYWEMHNALFTTQETWAALPNAEPMFDSLARSVGVPAPAYRQCMSDHVMRPLVQQDFDRSKQSGVGSTPTFFVGDTAILGAYPTPVFRRVIYSAVARAARRGRSP